MKHLYKCVLPASLNTLLLANTNRMVKVLLQAHEVRRLYCAQMIKEKLNGMSKGSNAVTPSTTLVGMQSR